MNFGILKDNQFYLDLVTSQHYNKPNFMALVESRLEAMLPLADILQQEQYFWELETAIGFQLDCIGEMVGASRLLRFNSAYSDNLLDDEHYRTVIKAKIITNMWDGTIGHLMSVWNEILPDVEFKILDHQDMTVTYQFVGMKDLFLKELIHHAYYSPKPIGVGVKYEFTDKQELETDLYVGIANTGQTTLTFLDTNIYEPVTNYKIDTQLYVGTKMTQATIYQELK